MVRNYIDEQLLKRVKELKTYKGLPDGYWILGVRSNADIPDRFDDKFYLWKGDQFIMVVSGTTNPGASILKGGFRKYNNVGAFVLKSDEWYHDVWKYGYHNGRMEALKQVRPMRGYRDGNLNGKSEEIGEMIVGLYGINFHAATYNYFDKIVKTLIGGWSAGCQVVNDRQKYNKVIELVKNQSFVTYCLINEF